MDIRKRATKSLRNVHKETVLELKQCPQKLTNEFFYSFMRINAFKISKAQLTSKTKSPVPSPSWTDKHKRDPKLFQRSFSPKKRNSVFKGQSSNHDQKLPFQIHKNLENDLGIRLNSHDVVNDEKNYDNIFTEHEKREFINPEYRKKYNTMFKGKISKSFMKFNN